MKPKLSVIAVGMVVLVLIAAGAYLFIKHNDDKKKRAADDAFQACASSLKAFKDNGSSTKSDVVSTAESFSSRAALADGRWNTLNSELHQYLNPGLGINTSQVGVLMSAECDKASAAAHKTFSNN